MGESRCQIIIIEGNLAYAATEIFAKKHPSIETAYLESAIKASCDGIHHASLYFLIEGEEDKLTDEFTDPIIAMHKQIILDLTSRNYPINQEHVNELAIQLFRITRKLYTIYGVTVDSLGLLKLTDIIK